jgi:hypothetical protein
MSVYHEAKGSLLNKVIIVILLAVLIYVIYEPYKIREQEEFYKRESRTRMLNIRAAQLQYINRFFRYNTSLDSLVQFIHDSVMAKGSWQGIFLPLSNGLFVPESLLHSPKSLRPYELSVNDTSRIKKYLLVCPDGYGSIGSITDDSRVNKASWEE